MAYSRNANSLQVLSDVDPVLNFFSLENNLFLVNARDIFFYKKIGTVNGIQYFVFFEKKPSNVDTPEGFCGSGNEIWLNLYKVGEKASTFIDQVLISSCKESFSMEIVKVIIALFHGIHWGSILNGFLNMTRKGWLLIVQII